MEYEKLHYENLADEEVVELSASGDKNATEYILSKYKNLVRARARQYFLIGADRDDLVQEGMIGLFKAIRDFDNTKQASFRAFAELCIKRQIITAIKSASRQKHQPLNSYISLDKSDYNEDTDGVLLGALTSGSAVDPEEVFLQRENIELLKEEVEDKLSSLEKSVFELALSGLNYLEIAKELNRSPKSIDNALQRVKRKMEN